MPGDALCAAVVGVTCLGIAGCLELTMLAACCGERKLVLAAKLTSDVCAS